MSLLSRPGLVLLEIAAAAALVGVAYGGAWLVLGVTVAVLCAVLALVPIGRRPLFRVLQSRFAMAARRRHQHGQGVTALVGDSYDVVTLPASERGGAAVGVVRDATTWSVPLALPLDGILNEDEPVAVDLLAKLLTVEGVPLSAVRLVTMVAPRPDNASEANPPAGRFATRHLVLTLDTLHAAEVLAERGGEPAVHQVLRRCVLRAEELLTAAGTRVRRLPADAVAAESASSLGPLVVGPDGTVPAVTEAFDHVAMADSRSTTYAVTGDDVLAKLDQITRMLPVPMVATSVVLQPGPPRQREPRMTVLLRLTGPASNARTAESRAQEAARRFGLTLHTLAGEQAPHLRATTLLGVAAEAA